MSFADTQLKIAQKKAKYEKLMKSPNIAERTAAMLMHSRAVNAEDILFNAQEVQKPAVTTPIKALGGPVENDSIDWEKANAESQAAKNAVDLSGTSTFENWNKNNNLASGIQGVLTGADYFSKMAAIKRMQAPPKVISNPMVRLNKTLDNGVERSAITRARINSERSADQLTGLQSAVAFKQKAGVDYLNSLAKITQNEQNFKTEQGNREAEMNSRIGMSNVEQLNNYAAGLNDFYNNKIAAKQGAVSSLLTKTALGVKDNFLNKTDMTKWDINSMQYDRTVRNDINNKVR